MDADKSGGGLGLPVLVALCGSLLGKNTRGGTIIVGGLTLGGSIDMISNAVRIAELAIDKQATAATDPEKRKALYAEALKVTNRAVDMTQTEETSVVGTAARRERDRLQTLTASSAPVQAAPAQATTPPKN